MKKIFASLIATAVVLVPSVVQASEAGYLQTVTANFKLVESYSGLSCNNDEKLKQGYSFCSAYSRGYALDEIVDRSSSNANTLTALGYAAATKLCPEYKTRIPTFKMKYFLGLPNLY